MPTDPQRPNKITYQNSQYQTSISPTIPLPTFFNISSNNTSPNVPYIHSLPAFNPFLGVNTPAFQQPTVLPAFPPTTLPVQQLSTLPLRGTLPPPFVSQLPYIVSLPSSVQNNTILSTLSQDKQNKQNKQKMLREAIALLNFINQQDASTTKKTLSFGQPPAVTSAASFQIPPPYINLPNSSNSTQTQQTLTLQKQQQEHTNFIKTQQAQLAKQTSIASNITDPNKPVDSVRKKQRFEDFSHTDSSKTIQTQTTSDSVNSSSGLSSPNP